MVLILSAFEKFGEEIKYSHVIIKDVPTLGAWSAVRVEFEEEVFL